MTNTIKTNSLSIVLATLTLAMLTVGCGLETDIGSSSAALTRFTSPSPSERGGPYDTSKECKAAAKAEDKATCANSACHTPCEKKCKAENRELDGHKAGACLGVADGEGGTKKQWQCSCDCGDKLPVVETDPNDPNADNANSDNLLPEDEGINEVPDDEPMHDDHQTMNSSDDEEWLPEDACDGTVEPYAWM